MTQIGNHDDAYLSTPLEEKLAWFQNAPGLSAVEPARQFMAGAAALYTDSDTQVRATMRGLGADWTGDAAANAGGTLQRAADWSQGAGAGSATGGQTVEGYGQSFESLRGQVHWDDPWAWGWSDTASAAASVATLDPAIFLGNLTADYFTTAQQNRTNDAAAVAALRAHEQQTRAAVASFPSIAPAGIDPSSADPSVPSGGQHPGAAPVTPAGVSTAETGGIAAAGPGGLVGGVAAGVGAAGGAARATATGAVAGGGVTTGTIGRTGGATTGAVAGPEIAGPIGVPGASLAGAGAEEGASGRTTTAGAAASGLGSGGPGGARGAAPADQPGLGGLGGLAGTTSRTGADVPSAQAPGGGSLRSGEAIPGGRGAGLSLPGSTGSSRLPSAELRGGDAAGRVAVAPHPGGETSGGLGGWRDLVSRGPSEPGVISRGPAAGAEFAARLPSGSPEAPPPTGLRGGTEGGTGTPFLGGMGAGAGARSAEHRNAYWIRSSEPFDVPLPPHGDGLLQGSDE